jgi:hypothetical protein
MHIACLQGVRFYIVAREGIKNLNLKGLSQEMDLAFDGMHGQF